MIFLKAFLELTKFWIERQMSDLGLLKHWTVAINDL